MEQNSHLANKKQQIIQSAYKVFYESGFHAAGVDSLLADTGISKRTLYKYFRSKDELIAATVSYYQQQTFQSLADELAKRTSDPQQKIIEIFALRKEAFERGDFSGCFATNAKLEFEGKSPLVEQHCSTFVKSVEAYIAELCDEAGLGDSQLKASKIAIILQGAVVYGQSIRNPAAMDHACEMTRMVLRS